MQHVSGGQASLEGGGKQVYRQASPTEAVYLQTRLIVVSRSSIAGAVAREQFETAVAALETRYGILRSVVENGVFVQRADDRSSVETWVPPEGCSAAALYERLLNAELDTRQKIYGIHVIAADDHLDVFMLSAHAVTDATSLVELHSCLAHLCDSVVRGAVAAVERQPFPTPIDAAVDKSLATLAQDGGGKLSYSGAYAEIPMPSAYDGGPVRHRLDRLVIAGEDVHRIVAASHANGSSLHSLLLAAFALAVRDVAEGRPGQILVRSSVDMRRRLEPPVSTGLVFTAITGHVTLIPDLDLPFFEIARLIFRDIHQGVANGSILHDYVDYPKVFGSPQQAPVAINISDMQSVRFAWPMERLKVTGFEYATGWMKRFPNVSVSVYEGKLVANTAYVEEFVDPKVMRTISESVARRLLAEA